MSQFFHPPSYGRFYTHPPVYPPPVPPPLPTPAPVHMPIEIRFGSKLRALRKSKKFTQSELAEYLGIDRTHISNLENGKKGISLIFLQVIAQGFDMPLSELMKDL